MKISELLNEGMYVVKSKDGVEKRFKDVNSAEAKAWAASTRKKSKLERYSQEWWEDKEAKFHNVLDLPWTKITPDEVSDQFKKIARAQGFGRIDDWSVAGRGEVKVDGVFCAVAVVRMMFSFGKEDDMGLDVEGDERVSDSEYIKLRRDTKNPNKLVFAGFGQRISVSEGEVINAKFGKNKGVERDSGIEIPKGYDRFMVDGKKIIGIKGDKKFVVSTTSDEVLARELVKIYNTGGKTDSNIKPVSMIQAFGSSELAALENLGIKLTEKPDSFDNFEDDGYAEKRNIHQVALKKIEKTIGKIKEYTSTEIYGYDLKDRNKGMLASYKNKPEEQMYITKFNDGTRYLCDRTGASSYTRFWQKIA